MTKDIINDFTPLHDGVLIKRRKPDNKVGSFYIPDQSIEKPMDGEVIKIGTGVWIGKKVEPLVVKPGDKILFNRWAGEEIVVDGEDYLLIKESDIIAIVD